jgi:pyruvate formate lyase activating enzyme
MPDKISGRTSARETLDEPPVGDSEEVTKTVEVLLNESTKAMEAYFRVNKETEGVIFDIERYMIEDGPGIRTGVFMKGCPLKCLWCCNPEGRSFGPTLTYLDRKCVGCLTCVVKCPNRAVTPREDGKVFTDRNKCQLCGVCVESCPAHARELKGKIYTIQDVVEMVLKDTAFYRRHKGGITVTGGEPLCQARFVRNLLKRCGERLIHTTMETSGFGTWEDLRGCLEYLDLIFIDIKHMDLEEHKKLTGVSNKIILENIRRTAEFCSSHSTVLIVRVPVIPGLNNSEENIAKTAEFVKSLKGNIELNLLPYHKYGVGKYNWLETEYALKELEPPPREAMRQLQILVQSKGVHCTVGGSKIESA